MKMPSALLLTTILFPAICMGADNNGNFGSSLPVELKDCDSFITALDDCLVGHCYKRNLFDAWLNGYITAYNVHVDDTYNIMGKRDSVELAFWLANYCKKHQHSTFDTAVGQLMAELAPQRIKEKPKD